MINSYPGNIALIMFSGDMGGTERVVLTLSRCFYNTGIDFVLYVVIENRAGTERTRRLRMALAELPEGVPQRILTINEKYSKNIEKTLAESIQKDGVTLVHCHCHKSAFYLTRIKKKYGLQKIPLVLTIHGLFLDYRKLGSIAIIMGFLYVLFKVDVIIFCAQHLMDRYSWLPWLKKKCKVIQNCLTEEAPSRSRARARALLAERYGLDEKALWVGNIGRLAHEKNFHLFIEIATLLTKETLIKVQYLVIGDGPLKTDLEAHAHNLITTGSLVFTGFIADSDVVYRAIDVFMMTSLTEGTSMALLEAMRDGLPVVITAVGGNIQVITHGKDGLLFPSGDRLGGKVTLASLLESCELRKKLGNEAHATWLSHFSAPIWLARHKEIYRAALEGIAQKS